MEGNILFDFAIQTSITTKIHFIGPEGPLIHVAEPDADMPVHFVYLKLGDAWMTQLNEAFGW